jgi:DNA invertase Pin-like site-specific DNA recombinase
MSSILSKVLPLLRDFLHNIVDDLATRGIGLKVLTGQGANIDTTTATGKLISLNL